MAPRGCIQIPRENQSGAFVRMFVEPLTFVAVLSFAIEFSSIQDLIYTKICLQVIDSNQTIKLAPLKNSTEPQFFTPIDNEAELSLRLENILVHGFTPAQLNSKNETSISTPVYVNNEHDDDINENHESKNFTSTRHMLCDKLKRTALPSHFRDSIKSRHSLFWLKYELLICLLSSLTCPYWGSFSDRITSRILPLNIPILAASLGNLVSLTFALLLTSSELQISIEWLYVGAILVGASGGQAVVIVNSFSIVSDTTVEGNRSRRTVVLESAMFVARSLGFYLVKHIMSLPLSSEHYWQSRHFVAFTVCAALNSLCLLYSALTLSDDKKIHQSLAYENLRNAAGPSAPPGVDIIRLEPQKAAEKTRPRATMPQQQEQQPEASCERHVEWPRVGRRILKFVPILGHYRETWKTATKARRSRSIVLLLLLCSSISIMTFACLVSLSYSHLRSEPFDWSTSQYSQWHSWGNISQGTALVILTLILKRFTIADPMISVAGYLSKGLGIMMFSLGRTSELVNWALLPLCLSEFTMPPIRSLLSKLVAKNEAGKIFSCLATLQSLSFFVVNIIVYLTYTCLKSQNFIRNTFVSVGCLQFVAAFIMIIIYKMKPT